MSSSRNPSSKKVIKVQSFQFPATFFPGLNLINFLVLMNSNKKNY